VVGKGNTRVLAIHPMARNAIVGERLLTIGPGIGIRWQWILLALVADQQVVLREGHGLGFNLAWRISLATSQPHR